MTALDPRALDHAISEFISAFQPPRLTGDPDTDRGDYAAAVGEALEGAIGAYLRETVAGDSLADFLEPDDELVPSGGVLHVRPWDEKWDRGDVFHHSDGTTR